MKPILRLQDFIKIKDNPEIRIYDVRTGPNAVENYKSEHVKNAAYVSLDKDLAEIGDFKIGGRHPLPSAEKFAETLGNLGINPNSHVVIYDDKNGGNAAARFWWMLKALGHEKVQVLDGGLQHAKANNIEIESGDFKYEKTHYPSSNWNLPTIKIDDVEKATQDKDFVIIDVRENQRYAGITEPIDLIAGHIPNAINIPFAENLDDNGNFKTSEELHEKYKDIFDKHSKNQIVVHCGSGVTACHTLLAMSEAGYEIPNLYVGSWSEWSRNKL
ncbi:sulfurtransferase [Soonwooa sp.]|uniref:sulfurtransferase n=1 Tax=Soonwooa sp. TaxID=1938592 RepID=UPI00261D763E|nr:sulfurtransferase [Soonwooa sp.]